MSPAVPSDATHSEPRAEEHGSDQEGSEPRDLKAGSKRNDDSDDNETQATRENLSHTTISDKEPEDAKVSGTEQPAAVSEAKAEQAQDTRTTPEPNESTQARDEDMKDHLASPRKKRGREYDDDARDGDAAGTAEEAGITSNGSATNGGQTPGSEPVKKRHRDASSEDEARREDPSDTSRPSETDMKSTTTTEAKPVFGSSSTEQPKTSSSAFANSGFGSLASSTTSGFAALAGKPSVFSAGSKPAGSGFGALASGASTSSDSSAPKLGFASPPSLSLGGAGFGGGATSGFGTMGSGFGSGFGGFASTTGAKLSSFAAVTTAPATTEKKPAKAFGAPESDEEEDEDDEEGEGGAASDEDEAVSVVDEKKKQKFVRVPVTDGEEGEATLLQVRAKLYTLESKETGWKERGVGNIKLNVNHKLIEYHDDGSPMLGTFDPSSREDDEEEHEGPQPVAARLVMRQENTHRVILNTVILKAQKFDQKSANSAIQILFTAIENGKPVNMLLKMSETNARTFTSEVALIQREL